MLDKDKLVETLAAAVYEVDPYPNIETWEKLLNVCKQKKNRWYSIAKAERDICYKRVEIVLNGISDNLEQLKSMGE